MIHWFQIQWQFAYDILKLLVKEMGFFHQIAKPASPSVYPYSKI